MHNCTTTRRYWRGYDGDGRPILWVRPQLKNWKKIDVTAETKLHVMMIEEGEQELLVLVWPVLSLACMHPAHYRPIGTYIPVVIRLMPPGVTTFTIIADASGMGLGQMNIGMMKALLQVITTGYPDRMGRLFAGPGAPACGACMYGVVFGPRWVACMKVLTRMCVCTNSWPVVCLTCVGGGCIDHCINASQTVFLCANRCLSRAAHHPPHPCSQSTSSCAVSTAPSNR